MPAIMAGRKLLRPPISPSFHYSFLLLSTLLLLLGSSTTLLCSGQGLRLELLHRHHPELAEEAPEHPRTRLELLRELAFADRLRASFVGRKSGRRATEVPPGATSFTMPISSGAYARTGQYFVRLRIGTPARSFLLVADTGSDLTWMNCRYNCRNCTVTTPGSRRRRIFMADKSSTFRPIECSSAMCKTALPFSLTQCPMPISPCAYDYSYADGASAQGIYANESATVGLSTGQKVKFKNIVIGCSSTFAGSSFREADGVLGLGRSQYSFATKATARFGGRFSYCLVDHLSPKNATSHLTFGGPPASALAKNPNCESAKPWHELTYTKLRLEPRLEPFYPVEVTGISIGGTALRIPLSVWDISDQGGAIVDSGTSLTMLAEPAYKPVVAALSRSLKSLPKVQLQPFEFCFNTTFGYEEAMVPPLVVHFSGRARFQPPVKSYVIDAADGIKCLGFMSIPWPGTSIIGNILQQNFFWEFDLSKERLGFVPSNCVHEN